MQIYIFKCIGIHGLFSDCDSTEVEVYTRWIHTDTQACFDLIGGTIDFYNEDYRAECQWWQGLTNPPNRIARSYVTECYDDDNGGVKYKAKLCCQGAFEFMCATIGNVENRTEASKFEIALANNRSTFILRKCQ